MGTPTKRHRELETSEEAPDQKKFAPCDIPDEKLCSFIEWCNKKNFSLSPKVKVSQDGSCAQYGMIAVEDIVEGYCLFQVPRSCILMPSNTSIASVIEKDQALLSATNQWVPLLVSLLHEWKNQSSNWRPYLDLVPDFKSLDLPLFWEPSEREHLLKGTGVDLAVERDLRKIQCDYSNLVLPFFERYEDHLGQNASDFETFKKMVAFVMAYSFTEPQDKNQSEVTDDDDDDDDSGTVHPVSAPMMVPVADLLNHVTRNNAKLIFGKEALKMVTIKPVKKGEEIYNTYGQVSNLHLMHMYGFAEMYPDNTNDVVEIPVNHIFSAAKEEMDGSDSHELDKRWKFLIKTDVIAEDEVFVLGRDGFVTDDICEQTLKVLCMSKEEFKEHVDNEGWSDAESDSSTGDCRLDFDKIPHLNTRWKHLLKRMGELHLGGYPTSLEADEKLIKCAASLLPRERYSLYLAHGQKMLIKLLLDACSDRP